MSTSISGTLTTAQTEALSALETTTTSSNDNATLDKDAFLKLMLVQLQYQDPLEPLDSSEYISQMAQFTELEQMTNMADSMETLEELTSLISYQLDDLTTITDALEENSEYTATMIENQSSVLLQNEEIISEIASITQAMESYFASSDDEVTDQEILSLISE